MNSVEYQAGATLVDDGINFDIPYFFGKKKTFTIKPLKPGTIVRVSQKILKLEKVNTNNPTIQEFLAKGKNIEIIAGVISTSVINMELFKRWKYRWVKWLMLNKVEDLEHLYEYFLIVQRQSAPVFFYHIMALTPAMNFLEKEHPKAEKPSGGQSE